MADSTCQGQNIQLSLEALLVAMDSISKDIRAVQKSSTNLSEALTEMRQILKHYHDSHLHAYPHDGQDKYDVQMGRAIVSSPVTPSDKLLQEYNTNYDVDGNGLIYGTDFKLTGSNIPRILMHINDKLDNEKFKKQLTIKQYMATVPNHEKIWSE